jgi:cytochrome c oxidase subunit 2
MKRVLGVGCWVLALSLAAQPVKVVNMTAERFTFTPSQVKVKAGTLIEFVIESEDTNHGFRIPAAGINAVIPKRGKGELRVKFHAEKPGRYLFECSKPCGAGHNIMRGVIIVE